MTTKFNRPLPLMLNTPEDDPTPNNVQIAELGIT